MFIKSISSRKEILFNHFHVRVFGTIVISVLFTSCYSKFKKQELAGHYVWNDGRPDTLELRANGSYEYSEFKSGQRIPHSGTWKLNAMFDEVEFELENFPFLKNHIEGQSWFSRVRLVDQKIRLMYSTGETIYLSKVDSSEE
jgi:hypothetical protein